MKKRASELSQKEISFYADQFGSPDVTKGYEPMGNEITKQLGDKIDILCASVGTGGAVMGAWKGLRKAIPKIELVAFEPLQSPLLTTGKGGSHQVEGVGVGFKPPFLDQSVLTKIRAIDQEKVFAMCRQLAHKEGFFVVPLQA